jgi:hypothetical protein
MPDDMHPNADRGSPGPRPRDDLRGGHRRALGGTPDPERDVSGRTTQRDDRRLPRPVPRLDLPLKGKPAAIQV